MTFTVLTAEFAHETNTFNKNLTDYPAFVDRYGYHFGDGRDPRRGAMPIRSSPASSIARANSAGDVIHMC
jgi:microcystin degradation protein MlrC